MLHFLLARPTTARLAMAVCMAAQVLGWITYAQAGEPVQPAAPQPSPPPPNALPAVRLALREFDRFLDHHPLLEDQLRLDGRLIANQAFLAKTPELRDFLRANPNVGDGLKVYPRYFLNRALLRQASTPLSFVELAPFKDLFQQEPKLERELTRNPQLVRDPAFHESHPELREFFVRNPPLARVFLPPSVLSAHP
jgi:hypothetical protein